MLPDWGCLAGLLPRGCVPTDADGIVEIGGNILQLEFKSPAGKVKMAQDILFTKITRFKYIDKTITVMVLWGKTVETLTHIRVYKDGKVLRDSPCSFKEFAEIYSAWGKENPHGGG